MKILVLDNYDSFAYNLVHYIEEIIHQNVAVYRNDEISLEAIDQYDKILLSPGPGLPEDSGILIPLIKKYAKSKSIFGVCLGMQAIAEVFGGKLINLNEVYHGVATQITITDRNDNLFKDIPPIIEVGRYHSWVVDINTLPKCLSSTSMDTNNTLMSLKHRTLDVKGVQFHPESILTEYKNKYGKKIIENWLNES